MENVCNSVSGALRLLVFDAYDGSNTPCINDYGVYAFSMLASIAFVAVTVVDIIIFLLKKYGLTSNTSRVGFETNDGFLVILFKASLAIVTGAMAAWIVAFLAAIVEFLKIAPQTAVATGALWQVAYSQLLTRLGNDIQGSNSGRGPVAPTLPPPVVVQRAETEVAE